MKLHSYFNYYLALCPNVLNVLMGSIAAMRNAGILKRKFRVDAIPTLVACTLRCKSIHIPIIAKLALMVTNTFALKCTYEKSWPRHEMRKLMLLLRKICLFFLLQRVSMRLNSTTLKIIITNKKQRNTVQKFENYSVWKILRDFNCDN